MIIEGLVFAAVVAVTLIAYARRSLPPVDPNIEEWLDVADSAWDYRDDTNERGVLGECWYCNAIILFDGDAADDFNISEPEIHCDGCNSSAQRNLCG